MLKERLQKLETAQDVYKWEFWETKSTKFNRFLEKEINKAKKDEISLLLEAEIKWLKRTIQRMEEEMFFKNNIITRELGREIYSNRLFKIEQCDYTEESDWWGLLLFLIILLASYWLIDLIILLINVL